MTKDTKPRPPIHLAADLWDALGAPSSDFDAYYARNGWGNTWSNLLGAVRDRFRSKCGEDTEGERCILTAGHLPPHYGPSDVGSSDPVPVAAPRAVTLEDVSEATSLKELIDEARSEGVWCCESGCGSGACEACPCCSAGWCVSGVDGVPDDPEDRERWLEVAADHNPVAAALRVAEAARS